jgi:hypothetical protein
VLTRKFYSKGLNESSFPLKTVYNKVVIIVPVNVNAERSCKGLASIARTYHTLCWTYNNYGCLIVHPKTLTQSVKNLAAEAQTFSENTRWLVLFFSYLQGWKIYYCIVNISLLRSQRRCKMWISASNNTEFPQPPII